MGLSAHSGWGPQGARGLQEALHARHAPPTLQAGSLASSAPGSSFPPSLPFSLGFFSSQEELYRD